MNQRSSMLETENLRLRAELATFRDENSRLKQEVDSLKNIRTWTPVTAWNTVRGFLLY